MRCCFCWCHWVCVVGGCGVKSFLCRTQLLSWVGVVTIFWAAKSNIKQHVQTLNRMFKCWTACSFKSFWTCGSTFEHAVQHLNMQILQKKQASWSLFYFQCRKCIIWWYYHFKPFELNLKCSEHAALNTKFLF